MRENLIVAAILTAGAVIRFYRLDLTWFFLDQARDVAAAAGIAAGASFPLLGPRIGWTEAYLGPLYFYLMAIPFSIARDPVAGAAFVAVGHLAALLALYRFAREFFGPRVAAYASALFAVFPLTIFSSRLVWHAGLLPPLIVLYMHALYRLVVRGHSGSVVPLLGLLAALTQLHLTSIALAGVALMAVLLFRPRLRIGHVLGGAALFLFLYLPYVVYEVGHRFENVRALSRFGASAEGLAPLDGLPRVVGNLLLLFSPALSGFVLEADWSPAFLAGFWILYHVEAALFGIGLVLCISRLLMGGRGVGADQGAERRRMALLLLWVSVPVLILGGKKTALWWYYLDVVYPSPFVLAGLAIASAPSLVFRGALGRKHAARALAGLAAAIVVSQAYFQLNFQRKVVARGEVRGRAGARRGEPVSRRVSVASSRRAPRGAAGFRPALPGDTSSRWRRRTRRNPIETDRSVCHHRAPAHRRLRELELRRDGRRCRGNRGVDEAQSPGQRCRSHGSRGREALVPREPRSSVVRGGREGRRERPRVGSVRRRRASGRQPPAGARRSREAARPADAQGAVGVVDGNRLGQRDRVRLDRVSPAREERRHDRAGGGGTDHRLRRVRRPFLVRFSDRVFSRPDSTTAPHVRGDVHVGGSPSSPLPGRIPG